jgi:hypothetical protein
MNRPQINTNDRESLEAAALETVCPDLYYDLADDINNTPDRVLFRIVEAAGDISEELKIFNHAE